MNLARTLISSQKGWTAFFFSSGKCKLSNSFQRDRSWRWRPMKVRCLTGRFVRFYFGYFTCFLRIGLSALLPILHKRPTMKLMHPRTHIAACTFPPGGLQQVWDLEQNLADHWVSSRLMFKHKSFHVPGGDMGRVGGGFCID